MPAGAAYCPAVSGRHNRTAKRRKLYYGAKPGQSRERPEAFCSKSHNFAIWRAAQLGEADARRGVAGPVKISRRLGKDEFFIDFRNNSEISQFENLMSAAYFIVF
jgi:hypothetical protein